MSSPQIGRSSRHLGIHIDVGHLRAVSRELGVTLNLERLIERLCRGATPSYIAYYDCPPVVNEHPTPAERATYLQLRAQLDSARRLPNVRIRLGELISIRDEATGARRWKQSGVDTSLAIDLCKDSSRVTDIALITNDLDIAPGIKEARANGARVHLWAGQRPNYRLAAYCTSVNTLVRDFLAAA